jgi:hypothetical protein
MAFAADITKRRTTTLLALADTLGDGDCFLPANLRWVY